MPRISPTIRAQAVQRLLDGESYADIATELGQREGTLRQWVKRHRDSPANIRRGSPDARSGMAEALALVPPVDPLSLSPVELLEQDIRDARDDLEGAREAKYWNAVPQLRNAVRKMQEDLDARKASESAAGVDDDDEIRSFLLDHTRVKRWVRDILDDRRSRLAIEAVQAE